MTSIHQSNLLLAVFEVQEGQSGENKKHDDQKVDQRHHHLVRDFWRLILEEDTNLP